MHAHNEIISAFLGFLQYRNVTRMEHIKGTVHINDAHSLFRCLHALAEQPNHPRGG